MKTGNSKFFIFPHHNIIIIPFIHCNFSVMVCTGYTHNVVMPECPKSQAIESIMVERLPSQLEINTPKTPEYGHFTEFSIPWQACFITMQIKEAPPYNILNVNVFQHQFLLEPELFRSQKADQKKVYSSCKLQNQMLLITLILIFTIYLA